MSLYDKIDKVLENSDILNEMAYKIGVTKSNFLIYVNSDDPESIPHFHYVDNASRQRKELNDFLKQPFRVKEYGVSNWEFIRNTWNDNNSQINVKKDQEMPDYMNLK